MTHHDALAVPQRAKLTVDDFLLLADAGAFADYTRTELIEGEIWVVNAVHRRHAAVHAMLTGELWQAVRATGLPLVLYTAPSTKLSKFSLPEPDIAVTIAGGEDRTVIGAEVRLAIEISDSTLAMDLGRKARLYAQHEVPEYWVVDVDAGVIHQMWSPAAASYGGERKVALGTAITSVTLPALVVPTTAG